ncbi:polyprenol monophosphomannose synthase [Candidatus Nomurabacteria bacterium]|nr:polyprenol monophosphomannose synthase [Candidatus Nomurabacteria bacterium]
MISLILPTYNEAKNIPLLVPLVSQFLAEIKHEIIIVDDNSPDGTALEARKLSRAGFPVKVIVRKYERGLASATVRGFEASKYPILAVMDSDLQHNPKYLPLLYKAIQNGAQMAIGSRYTKGSAFDNWPLHRKLISKLALLVTRPLCKVKDPLGQFYMVRKDLIKDVKFEKKGLRLSLEILVKMNFTNVVEIPIKLEDRHAGESKVLSFKSAFKELKMTLVLYLWKYGRYIPQILKQGIYNWAIKGL